TDKLSAIGCLKGVLTPVSKTGVSPVCRALFLSRKLMLDSVWCTLSKFIFFYRENVIDFTLERL
ncbi:hypothetical protein, partial [Bacillus inaquosorum]